MIFITVYVISLFGNATLGLYLIVHRMPTTIDRLAFNICLCQLLLPIFGIPFYEDIWLGENYEFSVGGCNGMNVLFHIDQIYEAFAVLLFAVYLKEKLSGEFRLFRGLLLNILCLFVCAIIIHAPYAAILSLEKDSRVSTKDLYYCVETWNDTAKILFRTIQLLFIFFIPLILLVRVNYKSYSKIRAFKNSFNLFKTEKKYQTFNNEEDSGKDYTDYQCLKFSLSEEMNLEMNQLYERDLTVTNRTGEQDTVIDGPSNDDDDTKHGNDIDNARRVSLFVSEVQVDTISRDSPLWREGYARNDDENQKLVFSKQWCAYITNLHRVCVAISVIFIIAQFPYIIMHIYSLMVDPRDYSSREIASAKAVLVLKFIPSILNPWILLVGIKKYRDSIFKCKKPCF